MIKKKTAFVIGAGASNEVGLPLGSELKKQIAEKMDLSYDVGSPIKASGDKIILDFFQHSLGPAWNNCLNSCWLIRDGVLLSASIDDYLYAHSHDDTVVMCGKVAIARCILEAEHKSKLYYEPTKASDTINWPEIANTWYPPFFELLSQGITKPHLESIFQNVTLVIFNYDRCVEQFLVHAIAAHYGLSVPEASSLVKNLTIYRPFGSVGPYFRKLHQFDVPFGCGRLPTVSEIVANLKTYNEQIEDASMLSQMRAAIGDAEVVVFLGNAFHATNMGLLAGDMRGPKSKVFFATRKGMLHEGERTVVYRHLAELRFGKGSAPSNHVDNHFSEECRTLFSDYRLALRE